MNQMTHGIITKHYAGFGKEKTISFEFPLRGYGKMTNLLSMAKELYKKSFLHAFQNVLTSKVE